MFFLKNGIWASGRQSEAIVNQAPSRWFGQLIQRLTDILYQVVADSPRASSHPEAV